MTSQDLAPTTNNLTGIKETPCSLNSLLKNREHGVSLIPVRLDVVADAAHEGCNVAVGHEHGQFKIGYAASSTRLYWGMVAGCGIDRKSLAFAYGKHTKNKPILGCAVIMNGEPVLVPMVMDESGRWVGAKHE